ncbi:hypothetical protein KJ766_00340, partial [Patescibacteria group bacterium]|nr:hypothetical protein [Patescibacteria group bacterium]
MKILALGFTGSLFFEQNLKTEIESRGHSVDFCSASMVTMDVGINGIKILAGNLNLEDYDIIHAGSIARNRWPIIAALSYLNKTNGCCIIDDRLISSTLDEYSGLARYIAQHENGLNTPRSIVFKLVEEIKDRLSEFEFPVVIKKNPSKMGQGVGLAKNLQEIVDFIK